MLILSGIGIYTISGVLRDYYFSPGFGQLYDFLKILVLLETTKVIFNLSINNSARRFSYKLAVLVGLICSIMIVAQSTTSSVHQALIYILLNQLLIVGALLFTKVISCVGAIANLSNSMMLILLYESERTKAEYVILMLSIFLSLVMLIKLSKKFNLIR